MVHSSTNHRLQWGRNFIVAEMLTWQNRSAPVDTASMGPQLYRCGNVSVVFDVPLHKSASMGPQLYRCGNLTPILLERRWRVRFNGAATLSLRKSRRGMMNLRLPATLQWGRNFIVAEMNHVDDKGTTNVRGFNGAATLSLRKL